MKEFKDGTLKTSAGKKVKSRKQAVAIAMSESEGYAEKADLISQINIDSLQEAEEILKAAGSEDLFEKAKHQDGDMHPNGKWVWVSSANGGKGDWRTKGGRTHTKNSTAGGNAGTGNTTTTTEPTDTTNTKPKKRPIGVGTNGPEKRKKESTGVDTLKYESKNGFKFKKSGHYKMRYNQREKAYEIWEQGDIYGAKTAMMQIKSENENIGMDIIKHMKEKYSKGGSGSMTYSNTTYAF